MAQIGADERTQGDERKAPGAEVVQGAGNKASPQPLPLEGGIDLRVDQHNGARLRPVLDETGTCRFEPELVALLLGVVDDTNVHLRHHPRVLLDNDDASFGAAAPSRRLFRSQRCSLLEHSTPAAFSMALWQDTHESRGVEIVDSATVSVAVVDSRTEAELIVGLLRSHGVSAAVSADDAGGQYPQMQMDGVHVLVAVADEATARRLLAAADDIARPDGGS
jgi:hypothetical protein